MTLNEKWLADLPQNLTNEQRRIDARFAAIERALSVLSEEVMRITPEARGRMGMRLSTVIETGNGLMGPMITAEARKLLGLKD